MPHSGRGDGGHGDEFGRVTLLRVGQVILADLPTVTTIRFQPIIVPRPALNATATLDSRAG